MIRALNVNDFVYISRRRAMDHALSVMAVGGGGLLGFG